MSEEAPLQPLLPGLDLGFVHRVYRTSTVLALLGVALIWKGLGQPIALGWLVGAAVCLLSMYGLEWGIRRYTQPDSPNPAALTRFIMGKMTALLIAVVLIAAGAFRGWINLFAVLAGFAMPHLVIALKLLGLKVLAAVGSGQRPARE